MFPFDVPTVSVDELPDDALLLDVREDSEWSIGHIEGALHVPMNQVPNRVAFAPGELATGATIVVVCRMGARSGQVAAWLNHQGLDAVNLDGGMLAWATSGRPMTRSDGQPPRVE